MKSALAKNAGLTALETEVGCKSQGRGDPAEPPVSSVPQDGMLGPDLIGSDCLDSKIMWGTCCVDQGCMQVGILCRGYELSGDKLRLPVLHVASSFMAHPVVSSAAS